MIKICIAWYTDKHQTPWDYVLMGFDIAPADVFLLSIDGSTPPDSKVVGRAEVIETAQGLPDLPLVVATPTTGNFYDGSEALTDFAHPEDCIYLFGADDFSLHEDQIGNRVIDNLVYIPVPGNPEINAHVAAAIVLYDRMAKHG